MSNKKPATTAKPAQNSHKEVKAFVKDCRKFGVKTKDSVFVELFMGAK